jgi:agmatine deiminase
VQNAQYDNGKGAPVRTLDPAPSNVAPKLSAHGKRAVPLPPKGAHDFHFNGWGGKYELRTLDDVVPQHIARKVKVPLWVHDMVLEGGSIDVNGIGTVMTTEQCLLNKNRNPRKPPSAIVKEIHAALGTRHVIWLPGGIVGDDTDGHIDDIARFVNVDTVVAVRAEKSNPDFKVLDANWKVLAKAEDQDGNKLNIIPLPAPKPILYNFPADRFGPGGLNPVPASYANFLIANDAVVVPIFGQKTDDVALKTLEKAMPGREIIGVRAESLVVGLGSFHCLSQQEPA